MESHIFHCTMGVFLQGIQSYGDQHHRLMCDAIEDQVCNVTLLQE